MSSKIKGFYVAKKINNYAHFSSFFHYFFCKLWTALKPLVFGVEYSDFTGFPILSNVFGFFMLHWPYSATSNSVLVYRYTNISIIYNFSKTLIVLKSLVFKVERSDFTGFPVLSYIFGFFILHWPYSATSNSVPVH